MRTEIRLIDGKHQNNTDNHNDSVSDAYVMFTCKHRKAGMKSVLIMCVSKCLSSLSITRME